MVPILPYNNRTTTIINYFNIAFSKGFTNFFIIENTISKKLIFIRINGARYDSYFVLKGCLGVVIFNKIGEIKKSYKLLKGAIYKTPKDQYHLTIPISKKVIYHEYRSGTFNRKTNCVFPRWNPKTEEDRIIFKKKILKNLKKKKY